MQNILVADDHPVFLDGLTALLSSILPKSIIHNASNLQQVKTQLSYSQIDLLLLDRVMPGMDGMKVVPTLLQQYPKLNICIISASDSNQHIREALESGAIGYIPKIYEPKKIIEALNRILSGSLFIPEEAWSIKPKHTDNDIDIELSPRQLEILQAISQGQSNKSIARELNITEGTVKQHVSNIFKRVNVNNRTLAIQRSRDLGLIS